MMPRTEDSDNVEIIVLSLWDKVAIVGGAAGLLLLVAVCMICVLCPGCWLYKHCCYDDDQYENEKKKEKIQKKDSKRSVSSGSSYGSTSSDYHSLEGTEFGPAAPWKTLDVIKESESVTSDWSSDTGSITDVIRLEKRKKIHHAPPVQNGDTSGSHSGNLESGTIEFTLKYVPSDNNLVITIVEVRDLNWTGAAALVSPYVKVRLYRSPKQFFTFGGVPGKEYVINNLDKEMKTKMQPPGEVLSYKKSFDVGIDSDQLRDYTIRFLLSDMDKLARHVILGEASISLRKINLPSFTQLTFTEILKTPTEDDLGTVMLGLSYLPTSEKLFLSVESIRGLKEMDKKMKSTDPCVKAYLMVDGKQLKRVKTTVKKDDLNPTFSENFSFDVPQTELGKVYFSVAVCHYDTERRLTRLIGRSYLGLNFDLIARDHWTSMMQNPRKKIVCEYNIQS